jgi:FixJ family two-component response regulator
MSERDHKTVFIVDDDEGVRKALSFLLRSAGYRVETFVSARDFIEQCEPARRGCILLDVCMPQSSGLDLQQELKARSWGLPVIFITGHGTIPTAVAALRAGALDFIEKPIHEDVLLDSIQRALDWEDRHHVESAVIGELNARAATLTSREREILDLVAQAEPNKVIARRLGISFRTVEIHRSHIVEKLGARTTSELIRMAIALESATVKGPG